MANKWTASLKKLDGAVTKAYDPFQHVIRSPSPSVNFIFGKTHGLPLGYSVLLWGPPKAGKTLLSNSIIGELHRTDPDAIVVKFDTEMRDEGQMLPETAETYGIDLDRYVVFQVNKPAEVFDKIETEIGALVQKGAPIKLIIIDSITGVQGRREANSDTIEQHNIGDHAQTVQIGLKRILPMQRKNRIALIVTAHARAELDMWAAKKSKTKAAASFGVLHHCEYFINIERNNTKTGNKDALERDLVDESRKDVTDEAERTGHRIKVWMQDSSVGAANRSGEFTIDYQRGIVNVHEEVFLLGTKWGIIKKPAQGYYQIGTQKYNGKPATLTALEKDPALRKTVIDGLLTAEKERRLVVVKEAVLDGDVEAAFEEAAEAE